MEKLCTKWGKELSSDQVWQEYPRPLMKRESYVNLNGFWEYAFTDTFEKPQKYDGKILVPFSPESLLSGINRQLQPDEYLWYRRTFQIDKKASEGRLLLHFGAVDQACVVYVNGLQAVRHTGGYLPFCADITHLIAEGTNELAVAVQDFSDTSYHARGKQKLKSGGMFYTAQSGIWQTVWMEWVPESYIHMVKCTPLPDQKAIEIQVAVNGKEKFRKANISIAGEKEIEIEINKKVSISLENIRLWTPESPYLYDYAVQYGSDRIEGYFAMRSFTVEKDAKDIPRLCLNKEPLVLKGVLDQGYWSDGLYTAPCDEAFIFDITEMKKLGFNMIRKHIKIEPQRWYYHCDRLGMLVWQDMVNGGETYKPWYITYAATVLSRARQHIKDRHYRLLARRKEEGKAEFRNELRGTIHHLYNHPSICAWVLFNEGWGQFDTEQMTKLTRKLDSSRWIDQASGWFDQRGGDIKSIHNYFLKLKFQPEQERACVLSEFGGYSLKVDGHVQCQKEYGYRKYKSRKKLNQDYQTLMEQDFFSQVDKGICGAVYTQLSDVEDEMNGIFTYDRAVRKIQVKI